MRQECIRRFAQLGNDIPSVIPVVTDAAGSPRVDVQVTMDGELLTSRLDGRSLPVDPGVHEFTFSADGGGTGAAFILWGRKDNSELATCSPVCQTSNLDHIRTMYLVGDIALGAGIAALGVSTVLFATGGSSKEKAPAQTAYSFDVQPTRSGAFATVSGKF